MKKQTWRTTRKEHISGSRPLALLLLLIGLFIIAAAKKHPHLHRQK